MSRPLHHLVAALAAWTISAGAFAEAPAPLATPNTFPAPPAAWSFRLGALSLTALRDGGFQTPNDGQDFGSRAGPAAVGALLAAAGKPTDRIVVDISALIVRLPHRLVLIDTGLGPAGHGALARSLTLARIDPAAVTDVLITHGHTDHVGGLVAADGSLAFPNAVIHISAREWPAMQASGETRALAAAIAPRVRTFETGAPVLPGVTPIALYGHTPGHVGYEIVSRGARLEDIGDMAHSIVVNLPHPDWTGGMDLDQTAGAATRRHELERLAARHALVFSPHFPFPGLGHIVRAGDGFAWKPVAERR